MEKLISKRHTVYHLVLVEKFRRKSIFQIGGSTYRRVIAITACWSEQVVIIGIFNAMSIELTGESSIHTLNLRHRNYKIMTIINLNQTRIGWFLFIFYTALFKTWKVETGSEYFGARARMVTTSLHAVLCVGESFLMGFPVSASQTRTMCRPMHLASKTMKSHRLR